MSGRTLTVCVSEIWKPSLRKLTAWLKVTQPTGLWDPSTCSLGLLRLLLTLVWFPLQTSLPGEPRRGFSIASFYIAHMNMFREGYGLNCVPSEFIVEVQIPHYFLMWLFGDRDFKEVVKFKWGRKGGTLIQYDWCLGEEEESPEMCTEKGCLRTQQDSGHL